MTTHLEDLKDELIEGQRLAVDEDGAVSWSGPVTRAPRLQPPHAPAADTSAGAARLHAPYLAEKILTSRSALEGERKQVTVLFADLKGSTELIRDLDPEAAQQLLDPALQRMMDAVHRYEGTVNQVLGDGIMALFGAPWPMRTTPCAPATRPWPCRPRCGATPRRCAAPRAWRCRCASGSTPGKSWCAPLATTCTWTTRPWARPRTWRRAWSRLATPGTILLTAGDPAAGRGLRAGQRPGAVPVKGLAEPGGGL